MAKPETRKYWPQLVLLAAAVAIVAVALWGASSLGSSEEPMPPANVHDWFAYEFAEVKGISQQFVTVVVGVLVFSITFSEKIVRYDVAHDSQRFFLKASWCCFALAIVGGGASIVLIMMAGAFVRYPGSGDYTVAQGASFLVLAVSGLVFVLGLVSLLASAFRKPASVD